MLALGQAYTGNFTEGGRHGEGTFSFPGGALCCDGWVEGVPGGRTTLTLYPSGGFGPLCGVEFAQAVLATAAAQIKADAATADLREEPEAPAPFIAAGGFEGAIPGYCFQKGHRGMGYYRDDASATDQDFNGNNSGGGTWRRFDRSDAQRSTEKEQRQQAYVVITGLLDDEADWEGEISIQCHFDNDDGHPQWAVVEVFAGGVWEDGAGEATAVEAALNGMEIVLAHLAEEMSGEDESKDDY